MDGVCEPIVPTTTTTTTTTTTPTTTTTRPTTTSTTSTTLTTTTTTPTTTTSTTTTPTTTTTTATTTTSTTSAPTITTTSPTTTKPPTAIVLPMSIRMTKDFDPKLSDKSSAIYKEYEGVFKTALTKTFESVEGFYRVNILGFTNGSILVSYEVITEPSASSKIITSVDQLSNHLNTSFPIDQTLIIAPIQANVNLTSTNARVSERDSFTLTCQPKVPLPGFKVKWFFNNFDMNSDSDSNSRTMTASATSGGTYSCQFYSGKATTDRGNTTIIFIPLPTDMKIFPGNLLFYCNTSVTLNCCIPYDPTTSYKVILRRRSYASEITYEKNSTENGQHCSTFTFQGKSCSEMGAEQVECVCTNVIGRNYSNTVSLSYIAEQSSIKGCSESSLYGIGTEGRTIVQPCKGNTVGTILAECIGGEWRNVSYNCVSLQLQSVLTSVQNLQDNPLPYDIKVPSLLESLANQSTNFITDIQTTTGNIQTVIKILSTISNDTKISNVSEKSMTDVIHSVNAVVVNISSWSNVNNPDASSQLLQSVERFAEKLSTSNLTFNITSSAIELRGIKLSNNSNQQFYAPLQNDSATVTIPYHALSKLPSGSLVVAIGYSTFGDILFNNSNNNNTNTNNNFSINGILITVSADKNLSELEMTFQKTNASLNNLKCVFWNFSTSSWENNGCKGQNHAENVTCMCNHLTSFSILMSSSIDAIAESVSRLLFWITNIGVGISMGSLVICLIIEGIVWKSVTKNKTSYMRHVCIVNIAVSLLIADIWFIIGASIPSDKSIPEEKLSACKTATFFIQYFYLCLFFWMFVMGMILFYRLVLIFHDMSKSTMMAIAFAVGYACPLLITVITIAVTEPQNSTYIRNNACWLNWEESRALLAFVIPALIIIALNLMILVVVIIRLLQPSVGNRPRTEEKSTLVKVGRSVAILTPFLGLTWGFGIGTVADSQSVALHVIFTILNAFQGSILIPK
ncbi:adhesion G protein-coupled receptor F5-like [Protopterus annectens]|uniref:adhesion G protein-coupled receptor F5-like n=1 Tax=Protopterus annectens TaxID=7888 RepID=UPI001CFA7B76|nr:adhesion G protein-coupled receptor F5-like [Protopterus annectens]